VTEDTTTPAAGGPPPARARTPLFIVGGALALLVLGGLMQWRAQARTNQVALSQSPKPVTVVAVKSATYRPSRTYVGTLQPWVEANVGPQLVSAYVETVLVRPGAEVRRGQVVATLDCRNASSTQRAVAAQARAIDEQQRALADEAARTRGLLDGGFVSPNEAEQKTAHSSAQLAELESTRAKLVNAGLEVDDCILRAPFDGEVSRRTMDPGAFARPGATLVTVVDRSTVRMTADAPETDFEVVAPGTPVTVHLYATNKDWPAAITRRAPAADTATRTVRFEIDLSDPTRQIPVGTTGEVRLDVGAPAPASELPLFAATLRGTKASVDVVEGDLAHHRTFEVKGERGGALYLETSLAPGTLVVTEGRALLEDGDRVVASLAAGSLPPPGAPTASKERSP
jgi:membrane fusion protein, multidrug efflux system